MIVYRKLKKDFLLDVADNCIEDIIKENVKLKLNLNVAKAEYNSWKNSLQYIFHVLDTDGIPGDSNVAIEYNIPRTNNRVDVIITGQDEKGDDHAVLIELKQWETIDLTEMDAIVSTRFQHGQSDEPHPSYQAWSYATLLEGFNTAVYSENILLNPCAYLHNHKDVGVVNNPFYTDYTSKAPVFCKGDKEKLQEFIKKYVKFGDKSDIIYRIDNGEIRPSKSLADSMASMIKGNMEFVMIDSQKVVYEKSLALAKESTAKSKRVLVIEGGPGTGKSVIAVNLLVELTKRKFLTQYVTKNAAPRAVYESKLTGTLKKTQISNMFVGSGAFVGAKSNLFDVLIVDEAHRLNEKSGMFKNLGDNQIKELINSSKLAIFFLDEDQKVTLQDIGDKEQIQKWAEYYNAEIEYLELKSQFRCNGSNGYLAWLDNTLQIRETANTILNKSEYDFRILDDPSQLRDLIFEKNNESKERNKARLVAGYCWKWESKKDRNQYDIKFPDFDFQMKWNLTEDGSLWILKPSSINEIGCIHTCQGLEVDYVGVIIGDDLIVRNGQVLVDPSKRAPDDSSVRGYKKLMSSNPEETKQKLKAIIKNTYRTLMSRGMKGCYVYFTDKETKEFFKSRLTQE